MHRHQHSRLHPQPGARDKHPRAKAFLEQLWRGRTGVVSTQVLQECYVNIRKKVRAPLSPEEAKQWLADYLHWNVVVNDGAAVVEAIELEVRYEISFWDALVIHAAIPLALPSSTLRISILGDGTATWSSKTRL